MSELYNRQILRLAADIPRLGSLNRVDGTAERRSPLCGSKLSVEVVFDGRITDYAQQVKACALGQASASLFARHVVGKGRDELIDAASQMEAFLKGGRVPAGDWQAFEIFTPAVEHTSRHGSIMLPFQATLDAIEAAEAKVSPA
ncbi:MAG: iron-sulfur cluster assembly scaffold protein [Pseudomonadota bacterium]